VKHLTLAKRYVKAALEHLPAESYQEAYHQCILMKRVITRNPEIIGIITSGIVKKQRKIEFISSLIEEMANRDFWIHLLTVLIMKNRCGLVEVVLNEFENQLNICLNQKRIKLVFAHKPDGKTLDAVKHEIEKILNCKVVCEVMIDVSIVGGFIAKSDQEMIDASLLTSLHRFSRNRQKW